VTVGDCILNGEGSLDARDSRVRNNGRSTDNVRPECGVVRSNSYIYLKNSLIIQEQNTKKNHKRVVVLYVIKNHVNLHKL
jgi:hypothetical protein